MQVTRIQTKARRDSSLWLFYLAYGLLALGSVINSSELGFFSSNILYLVAIVLAMMRLLDVQSARSGMLLVLILLPVAGVCVLFAKAPEVFVAIVLVVAASHASFEKIVRVSLSIVLCVSAFIVLLSIAGVIDDSVVSRVVNGRLVECHSLGFLHYSKFPTYWFMCYLGYSYLNRSSYSLPKHFLWLVGGVIIYSLCHERLRFYLLVFAFVVFFLASRSSRKTISKGVLWAATLMFPAFLCISLIVSMMYDPSNALMSEANNLLSGRLRLSQAAISQYGVSLLGQNVDMVMKNTSMYSDNYFFIDSAFVYIPVVYGALITAVVVGVFSAICYKAGSRGDRFALCWCLCVAIDCFVGNQLMSIWLCPLPFMLTSVTGPTKEIGSKQSSVCKP